jgi:hypothetical protein
VTQTDPRDPDQTPDVDLPRDPDPADPEGEGAERTPDEGPEE